MFEEAYRRDFERAINYDHVMIAELSSAEQATEEEEDSHDNDSLVSLASSRSPSPVVISDDVD